MGTTYDIFMIALLVLLIISAALVIRSALTGAGGEVGGLQISGASRRIRAIARITLAEAIRAKIALLFIVLLVITLPVLCLTARGDGTIKGQVQMFVGYAIGLTSLYLTLLTIFFSSRTLAAEIASQQIHILATKPVPRWQILLGKWFGVIVLDLLLVGFAVAFTYGGTRWIVYRFERDLRQELVARGGLNASQAADCIDALSDVRGPGGKGAESPIVSAMARSLGRTNSQIIDLLKKMPYTLRENLRRLDELRRQILVARATVAPDLPDLDRLTEQEYKRLKEANRLPTDPEWNDERINKEIRKEIGAQLMAIDRLDARGYRMHGPPPSNDDKFLLSVRYKVKTSALTPEIKLTNGMTLPEETFLAQWIIGDPASPNHFAPPPTAEKADVIHEFEVPTHCVEPDGTVQVIVRNIDPRPISLVIPIPGGMEVLYRVGSFESNVINSGLSLMPQLAFFAALGLLMSTFCTFPVASLVGVVLYAMSFSGDFLLDSLSLSVDMRPDVLTAQEQFRKAITNTFIKTVSLGHIDASTYLTEGRAIGWAQIGELIGPVLGWRIAVLLLLAILVFRRRELASIIV